MRTMRPGRWIGITLVAATLAAAAPLGAAGPIKIFLQGEISMPADPVAVQLRPGTSEAWVSLQDGSLAVVDLDRQEIVGRVPDVGSSSWGLAFHPDGSLVYGTSWLANELAVIDASSREIVRKVAVGLKPAFVEIAPDGKRAWVSDYFSGELSIVDLSSWETIQEVDVGRRPMGLAVGPQGRWAYLASGPASRLTVVDLSEGRVHSTREVDFASTLNIDMSSDGSFMVAAGRPEFLLVFAPDESKPPARKIQVGRDPVGVALGPWDRYAFVTNYGDATLSVVELAEGRQVQTYPVAETPMFLTVDPTGRRMLVCSNKPRVLSIFSIGDPRFGIRPAMEDSDIAETAPLGR